MIRALSRPLIKKQIRQKARELRAEHTHVSQAKAERHIANALTSRINRMVADAKDREETRIAKGERALVPVDLVDAEIQRAHGEIDTARAHAPTTSREAVAAASEISLNRQTGGEKARQIGKE